MKRLVHWDSYIASTDKTSFKKVEVLIWFMEFFSPEITLYFYKFTIQHGILLVMSMQVLLAAT